MEAPVIDWKHASPAPHVGVSTVFSQAAPSAPGPALRQAYAVRLVGQHVCVEGHSHGFWLQGTEPPDPPLVLEQAAVTRARRRRTRLRMAPQIPRLTAPLVPCATA
jgi:hypothetical protein